MNPNYVHTITIYNCFHANDNPDSKKDIWQKIVLHNCFYKNVMGKTDYMSDTPKMKNVYTVRIPESDKYRPYSAWIKLSDIERKEFFTCSPNDIVIKGECHDEITGTNPFTSVQVFGSHKPEAFYVTAFSDNSSFPVSKHYRLGG